MNVKELIEELNKMPENAEVVSGTVDGAWAVLSKPILTQYRNVNVCVIKEGY